MFRERSYNQYSAENSCPSPEDPCVFMVPVKNGREDAIVLQILNKAAKMRSDKERKMNIISAISLKRRFSGYIFVEVRREKDANKSMLTVKKALEGMYDVFLGRVSQLKDEDYEKLFRERQQVTSSIRKDDYVRIKGGLYDEDLGKVYEVKKKSFDVTLVPRINIQEIQTRIKDLREKHENSEDRDKIISKAFKKYFDYREPRDLNRPPRRPTFGNELPDIRDVTHLKLTKDGFIILNFTGEELSQ
jgi:transcription antitermination factor NusG